MTAHQIPKPRVYGNFKVPLEERRPEPSWRDNREGDDESYRKLIKQLPCCVCGSRWRIDPHHVKKGVKQKGMALRSPDKFAIPLCRDCHDDMHAAGSKNEHTWFRAQGVAPLTLAAALWGMKHDIGAMYRVLIGHREQS